MNYCNQCAARLRLEIPAGDDRPRFVCQRCGTVHYQNPKMVVGCVPESGGRILLCRRAIEPRCGMWTLPAGFLENGETVQEGALREAWEEATVEILEPVPFAVFDLTRINQVYFMFRGKVKNHAFEAGQESMEVRLFQEKEIPWKTLAFPVIEKTLEFYFADRAQGKFTFHMDTITRRLTDMDG